MAGLRLLLVQSGRCPEGRSSPKILEDADFPAGCLLIRVNGEPSAESLVKTTPDVVVVEHSSDRAAALSAVRKLRALCASIPILFLAWESSEELIIEAFRAGVAHYLKLPCAASQLDNVLREMSGDLNSDVVRAQANSELRGRSCLIGNSTPMCELRRYIQQVAQSDSNVLITGETGTGKELVAQLVHENSRRRERPFVCLNSAAIPEALVESELFGYEKGAFTGATSAQEGKLAAANHGTVFFDEIGDVSPLVQAKLLRAIESKSIYRLGSNRSRELDIRILAATNHDLDVATLQNRFRGDLYYRLNVIRIEVPPLRDRAEDIPELVEYYIRHFSHIFQKVVTRVNPGTMELLFAYAWPGNIRELKNVLEASFVGLLDRSGGSLELPKSVAQHLALSSKLNNGERTMLLQALTATNWNRTKAAQRLHWSRMTLYRKMICYQIAPSTTKPVTRYRSA